MIGSKKYIVKGMIGMLAILLYPTLVFAAICGNDFCYGRQASGQGGPHALTSSSDTPLFTYDRNGDMKTANGGTNLSHTYSVNRKLKRAMVGSSEIRYFYTATGEKVAANHVAQGKTEVFTGDVRFTNDVPRYTYAGDVETNANGNGYDYFVRDHLGSVVATVGSSGGKERKDTLPYGEAWYSDASSATDRDFNGNLKEGALLDYNARHYYPEIAHFIQADSIIPHQDSLGFNRYAYVSNNPVNRIDPSGHADFASFGKWDVVGGDAGSGFWGQVNAFGGSTLNAVNNFSGTVMEPLLNVASLPGRLIGEENLNQALWVSEQLPPQVKAAALRSIQLLRAPGYLLGFLGATSSGIGQRARGELMAVGRRGSWPESTLFKAPRINPRLKTSEVNEINLNRLPVGSLVEVNTSYQSGTNQYMLASTRRGVRIWRTEGGMKVDMNRSFLRTADDFSAFSFKNNPRGETFPGLISRQHSSPYPYFGSVEKDSWLDIARKIVVQTP